MHRVRRTCLNVGSWQDEAGDEEEEEESEEEDDAFGPKKKVEEEDAVTKAKKQAVEKMQDATNMVSSLFKF